MNLSAAFSLYLPWIETELQEILASPEPGVARHYALMQYHMGWLDDALQPVDANSPAGKRLRPMLCLLTCEAAGGDARAAIPAAAGLELLHNFSLIHDDIEDNSPTRRHRPTLWRLCGVPVACNAGDAMFSLAHLAFHRLSARGLPPDRVLEALRVFGETCVSLTEGQYLDMSFEDRPSVGLAEYDQMIAGKTGALLAAAPHIGALLAGASSEAVGAYRRFGAALGRAFQLQDDVLGIWGDERVTGKSAASDILSKKKSLPVVYALEHAVVGPELRARYAGPAFTPADVPSILGLLQKASARAYVEAQVLAATEEARQALRMTTSAAASEAHRLLEELLDTLVGRAT